MPLQSSQTFSERRGDDGPIQLNRTNLSRTDRTGGDNQVDDKGKGDSAIKILIWVVVVVLVAVVIYLLINNLTGVKESNNTSDNTSDQEIQNDEGLEPIQAQKISSEGVESVPAESDFDTNSQSAGNSSTDTFTIDSFSSESYEGFFRIVFAISSSGSAKFPLTQAVYENEKVIVTFNNISDESSDIPVGEEQIVVGSTVTGILHSETTAIETEEFVINLDQETGYYLHLLEEPNRIVIDVQEAVEEEPVVEETVDETEEETVSPPAGINLTNEFSKLQQYIVSDVSGNVVNTTKYLWQDYGTYLRITYDLSGGIPNANAKLETDGTNIDLVVVMQNRVAKNATSTIEINHGNVTTMDAVTSGNTSTLTIHLVKESDFRIYATEDPDKFIIEVKD